jgi:hypothetical protein
MPPRFTVAGVVLIFLNLLLFFLALFLLWTGKIGPLRPSPDRVIVFVNEEQQDVKQPVMVKIGEPVKVTVQVHHQGQLKNPGDFTYQWCFDPPVNDNRFCSVDDYRAETNSDYKPENSAEQKLEITIKHKFLKTSRVLIVFEPE